MIALFYYDLLQGSTRLNKLNIPIIVETQVRMAQVLSIPLAVMVHEDCTAALYLLRIPYDPAVMEKSQYATYRSWLLTLFLRFMVGFLLVFVSFIQVQQASTVTDLFLNLESIVFVGNIDNIAFWLAEKGFIKQQLQEAAETVTETKLRVAYTGHGGRTRYRRILLALCLLVLVTGWAIIFAQQDAGVYLRDVACQSLTVNFDEQSVFLDSKKINDHGRQRQLTDINYLSVEGLNKSEIDTNFYYNRDIIVPDAIRKYDGYWKNETKTELLYSLFSGVYRLHTIDGSNIEVFNDRPVYLEKVRGKDSDFDHPTLGKFYYCREYTAWVFTIPALAEALNRYDDSECADWLMRSPSTESFTLEGVGPVGWFLWTGVVAEATQLDFVCNDCHNIFDCNYHGSCNGHTKQCDCEDGWFGSRCEVEPPCTEIALSETGTDSTQFFSFNNLFVAGIDGSNATSLNADDLLLIAGRPVFVSRWHADLIGVVFYSGSRYVHIDYLLEDFNFLISDESTWPIHPFWDGWYVLLDTPDIYNTVWVFVSERTFASTPSGLSWSRQDYASAVENVRFDCVQVNCQATRPCSGQGTCDTTNNRCICDRCYGGYNCDISPVSDYAITEFTKWRSYIENGGHVVDDNSSSFNGTSVNMSSSSSYNDDDDNDNDNDNFPNDFILNPTAQDSGYTYWKLFWKGNENCFDNVTFA